LLGDQYARTQRTDDLHQPASGFTGICLTKSVWVLIGRYPWHARISVAEHLQRGHPENSAGVAHFPFSNVT
jgi:hypothetical protein